MIAYKTKQCAFGGLLWIALALAWVPFSTNARMVEDKFDVLQIGARTYTNVTVTTKAKTYVFILHGAGMTSLRVSELPPEVQEKLGYATPKPSTNSPTEWAKREIAKINMPQVKDFERQLQVKLRDRPDGKNSILVLAGSPFLMAIVGGVLLVYLFFCYCLMLICRKTGNPGGLLVWIPGLQIFPKLRAAGMSSWWVLAYFVPMLAILPEVLWCFNIAKARGKSAWVGFFLLLPVTSLFAFLYLAFSDGGPADEEEESEPKVMTLQTA